jgi:RimJ/RimL family protein N-acetyltransferase
VARHALCELALSEIVADIHPGNVASIHLALGLGMKYRGDGTHDGVPCRRYAMTPGELHAIDGDTVPHKAADLGSPQAQP